MTRGLALTAAIAALSGSVHAATYNWLGVNNTTSNWEDPAKWSNLSGGTGTVPGAGDRAELMVAIQNYTYLDIKNGNAAVGSMYLRPQWNTTYRLRNNTGTRRTFSFNNNGSASTVTLSSATSSASYTGHLTIGDDASAMYVQLANDLAVNNDSARAANARLTFGSYATVTGGTSAAPVKITVQALGSGASTITMAGSATFVGDWIVDGAKATLDMNANSFGDASNSVDLLNGGTLDLNSAAFNAVSWDRSLSGNGKVIANTNGFTLGTGSFDLFGSGTTTDKLSITGNLILGPDSVLNLSGTFAGDNIPLVTTTGTVTGEFGTVNLPAGYDIAYTGNGVTLVVPEPGTIALTGSLGLLVAGRRKRSH